MNQSNVNLRSVYQGYDIVGSTPVKAITKITAAPQPAKLDVSTFLIGAVSGAFVTLLFIYGVAPAAFEWGAAKIRART
jgi:hypothetical protein